MQQSGPAFADLSARATGAREANDTARAIELYRQAVQLNPKWEEGWWFLGSLSYDSDQFAQAREALRHVVDMDAKAAPALALLGLCEFETGDYAVSLEHIQRALAGELNEPQMETVLRFHEALLLTHAGQFNQALEKYGWFVKQRVQNPELVTAMGLAALQSPLFPNQVEADRKEVYETAGTAVYLNLSGDYRNAAATYNKLVATYPNTKYVHYAFGCFLLGVSPELGIQQLRDELRLSPSSAAVNSMLAFALLERGDRDLALPYAKKAVDEQPDSELAQYVLGRALSEKGDREGIQHLELAEKLDPGDLQPHISLATAYSRAGRPLDARHEREKSIQLATGTAAVADR